MAAAFVAACALAADAGAVSVARDGAGVVLEWRCGLGVARARLMPDAGCSIGHVACAPAGSNTLFVAWESISADGSDTDLYAQHFGADGVPRWMQNVVVIKFRGHQRLPVVAVDGQSAYVAWQSDSAGPGNNNIWCQRIELSGRAAWATPAPVCAAPGDQTHPAIAIEPDGQVIVAWEDRRNGTADIYGQRLDPDGAPVGPEDGWAIEVAPGDQTDVRFERDATGAVRSIGWLDQRGAAAPVRVDTDLARLQIPEPVLIPLALCAAALILTRNRRARG